MLFVTHLTIPFLILKEDLSSIPCLLSIFSLPSLHQVFTSSLKPNENLMDSEDYKVASIILWGQKPKKVNTSLVRMVGSASAFQALGHGFYSSLGRELSPQPLALTSQAHKPPS